MMMLLTRMMMRAMTMTRAMTTDRRRMMLAAGGLAGLALAAGCLISGTKVFSQALPEIRATGGVSTAIELDLTENETFEDYQDKIRIIDRFGFSATIRNDTATPTTLSMYFSGKGDVPEAELGSAVAPALFVNFPIPTAGTRISYDESQKIIQNFEALRDQARTGRIYFYTTATGQGFDLTIPDMLVTITFTVGL
ncbi:MAG: hypothetical protein PVF43_10540 [Candidatus Eiseniibacteriota bacterium]|jgi:hypothetical protein